jgi:hypothetical protein
LQPRHTIPMADAYFHSKRKEIVALAMRHALPAIY